MKQVDQPHDKTPPPVLDLTALPNDLAGAVRFSAVSPQDMPEVAALRASSDPWKGRGENPEQSLQALTQLQPYVQVSKLQNHVIGYVTLERDGPVAGAAYMRNIVVKAELRRKGIGTLLLNHAIKVAKDLHRKTLALRVDPANSAAVSFYRKAGFTTVATVVSKKSGKLRLLMSREL
jgi:[ribosomal protein S18]-alanine N-acetyltransferase